MSAIIGDVVVIHVENHVADDCAADTLWAELICHIDDVDVVCGKVFEWV